MTKRILLLVLLMNTLAQVSAQSYGNEWISYSQSYYKFGVGRNDWYRISIAQLQTLGFPSGIEGYQIQLFRDGQEVPLYISNNGILAAGDYFEFYGTKANGQVDLPLYKNASDQLNPSQQFLSDTSFYFITYNTGTNHKRYVVQPNTIPASPPPAQSYFWDQFSTNYRSGFASGTSYYYATSPLIYLCSSQFDAGEGWVKTITYSSDSLSYTCLFP